MLIALALPVSIVILATRGKDEARPSATAAPAPSARTVNCSALPYKHHSPKLKDKLPTYKHLSLQAGIRPLADEQALTAALDAAPTGEKAAEVLEAMAKFELDRHSPMEAAKAC